MSTRWPPGDALPPLEPGPIGRGTLAAFARASGDPNPIHLDPAFARRSGHPDVFAHGMLSMAYVARMITDVVDQADLRSLRVRFRAVTPLGASPRCTATVAATDGATAQLDLAVALPDGTVTITGSAVVALD